MQVDFENSEFLPVFVAKMVGNDWYLEIFQKKFFLQFFSNKVVLDIFYVLNSKMQVDFENSEFLPIFGAKRVGNDWYLEIFRKKNFFAIFFK